MSTSHSMHLGFILHYNTLTGYYVVKDKSDDKQLQHNRSENRKQ